MRFNLLSNWISHRLLLGMLSGAVLVMQGCAVWPTGSDKPASPPVVAAPVVVASEPARPLKIGLALGGGAARGFAHIGVIKALEARGIVPDIIVGTSAGSVVGALYASGMSGIELNRLALMMDESILSDWVFPSRGVFKGQALEDYLNRIINNRPIEKMPRKFAATATDLQSGQLQVFERGNTGQAVRASSSVPGVFQPVRINGHEYVDGGLVTPVPVRVARRLGADVVIAVNISAQPASGDTSGTITVLLQTFSIMSQTINSYELREADLVIQPDLPSMRSTDFAARNSAVLAGEEAVSKMADQIRAVIEKRKKELNAQ